MRMTRPQLNTMVAILSLATMLMAQFIGNAGAVICVRSDGYALLEWGCECKHGHDDHQQHAKDHETLAAWCDLDPCTDLPVANLILIRDAQNRAPDVTVHFDSPVAQGTGRH